MIFNQWRPWCDPNGAWSILSRDGCRLNEGHLTGRAAIDGAMDTAEKENQHEPSE